MEWKICIVWPPRVFDDEDVSSPPSEDGSIWCATVYIRSYIAASYLFSAYLFENLKIFPGAF